MNQSDLTHAANDDLVAYLDGELDHDSSQRIEQQLARDPKYRQRLQQLQRAWDLLDSLPRATASGSFARTTVELVALNASQEIERLASQRKNRNAMGWLLGIAAVTATTLAGFLVTSFQLATPDRQLLDDLPVLERLDYYRTVDNVDRPGGDVVEFLRLLQLEQLFPQEESDAY